MYLIRIKGVDNVTSMHHNTFMKISDDIKLAGLPSSKFVYDSAGITKRIFYLWARRFPRVIDLMIKGLLYERDEE